VAIRQARDVFRIRKDVAYDIDVLPEVSVEPLPAYWMSERPAFPEFLEIFTLVLFIMIVQTRVGILQGVNRGLGGFFIELHGVYLLLKNSGQKRIEHTNGSVDAGEG
jgi:hypothetical protein